MKIINKEDLKQLQVGESAWIHVGNFSVDAGICWIGDPCYIMHREDGDFPEGIGKDWTEFCNIIHAKSGLTMKSFNFDYGHEGLGVCLETGIGDGFYPVYAKVKRLVSWGLRISEVKIKFL